MALNKFLEFFSDKEARPNKLTLYMGDAIRTAREEAGISQGDLAQKINRRQAVLSDIENGKVEVDASILSLFSYYLKKPLAYFYPDLLYEELVQGDMNSLSLEMQMHFEQIYGDDLKKLAINVVKAFGKFDPKDMVVKLAPEIMSGVEREKQKRAPGEIKPRKK